MSSRRPRNGSRGGAPGTADSYRPAGSNREYGRRRDSPPRDYGPRGRDLRDYNQQEPVRPFGRKDDMYQFRGNAYPERPDNADYRRENRAPGQSRDYRPLRSPPRGGSDSYRPPTNNGFDFRYDAPPTLDFSRQPTNQHPLPSRPGQSRSDRNGGRMRDQNRGRGARDRGGRGGRGGYFPKRAADRPFLQTNRQPTPERMAGMDEDEGAGTRFRPLEDVSDSDETDMDVSSDDEQAEVDDDSEQPKKKQARTGVRQAADGDSVPKWSNPDPYTALPPPDETSRKKKDVVKLIRKARVNPSSEEAPKPAATTDDFISFDFGDDVEEEQPGQVSSSESDAEAGNGVPGAPSGPRYSHKDSIHSLPPRPPQPAKIEFNIKNNAKRAFEPANIDMKSELDIVSDPALGNRKRTHNDEIKGPPLYVKKFVTSRPSKGRITEEWAVKTGLNPTPWCEDDHCESASASVW
jgi:non-canonical poly(A) RNA polymerase PAPD5/7